MLGVSLAVSLLAAAVYAALAGRSPGDPSPWDALRGDPWRALSLVAFPACSTLLTALAFLHLTRRFGRVPAADMLALITAANLLNYLPLRPGLLGRVWFHSAVHGIAVRHSARIVGESVALAALGFALAAVALVPGLPAHAPYTMPLSLAAACLALAPVARSRPSLAPAAPYLVPLGIKLIDTALWAGRYWVCFGLLGVPLSPASALALALVAQSASLVPIAGNGLGLREWAVALFASFLPEIPLNVTLTADLANRAAELVFAVPTGLIASAYLARRLRPHGRGTTPSALG